MFNLSGKDVVEPCRVRFREKFHQNQVARINLTVSINIAYFHLINHLLLPVGSASKIESPGHPIVADAKISAGESALFAFS